MNKKKPKRNEEREREWERECILKSRLTKVSALMNDSNAEGQGRLRDATKLVATWKKLIKICRNKEERILIL
jgi:hypothetical protein